MRPDVRVADRVKRELPIDHHRLDAREANREPPIDLAGVFFLMREWGFVIAPRPLALLP